MLFLPHYFYSCVLISLSKIKHFYLTKLSPKPTIHKRKPRYTKKTREERAWKIPSFRGRLPSSLTIEAALGLTLFLIFMISLCQLFLVMQLQLRIQKALEQVGSEAAQYSYLSSQVTLWDSQSQLIAEIEEYLLAELSEGALRLRFVDVMGKNALDQSVLVGGADGISFEESSLLREQHRLHLVVSYQIRLPVTWFGLEPFTLRQHCYRYAWLGDQAPDQQVESSEQMVYVTKTGQVYHLTLECTHLKLSVREVAMYRIEELRNDSGAKYYACELCEPEPWEAQVYITEDGTRYHNDRDCSGIQRYISSLPISQVEGKSPCSRCGQEE